MGAVADDQVGGLPVGEGGGVGPAEDAVVQGIGDEDAPGKRVEDDGARGLQVGAGGQQAVIGLGGGEVWLAEDGIGGVIS